MIAVYPALEADAGGSKIRFAPQGQIENQNKHNNSIDIVTVRDLEL